SEAANPANQPPAGKAALMAENSGRRGQQDPVINGPESRKIAKAQEKSPPVAADGRVSTRLVRVRARRTSRGYRYDLTFSMKEQAGRPIRWNLLAINSRSARGLSRSETIRVKDRISPGGALTFTVSVEMPGRVPADWRGRVTITSIGIDGAGRSVRAVYGAEVAP
ncbi:MAG TPA: hypothetical protein VNO70_25740, partial [Blastocatellia bacterium]|nr:hypothetical protein [Blastocatellia bacterium]